MIAVLCMACDPLADPVSGRLEFSSDTISFDTVFTAIGSATREVRVRNVERGPLMIERIWLGGGEESPFRLNIDGVPAVERKNITLARGDSLFIFVEVTIDSGGGDLPLAVTDSISFVSGGFAGRVILEAWGQDIRVVTEAIAGDVTWTAGRPYVIGDSLIIGSSGRLTMEAGTRVYMHPGAVIRVSGTMVTNGLPDKRVIIATDRLEREYREVPGRWRGIRFLDESRGNELNHTEIRNAVIAVEIVGSAGMTPDLFMNGTMLMHNTIASLAARRATLFAVNSLFAHSGFSTVTLSEGGDYEFIHCTIHNRWEWARRSESALLITSGNGIMPTVKVVNSVVSGNLGNEIDIRVPATMAAAGFRADSSMIKVDTLSASWYTPSLFRGVITSGSPGFIDEAAYDFRPDTLSPLLDCAGRGAMLQWPFDLRGKSRPAGTGPDMGAYERQPGEGKKEPRP